MNKEKKSWNYAATLLLGTFFNFEQGWKWWCLEWKTWALPNKYLEFKTVGKVDSEQSLGDVMGYVSGAEDPEVDRTFQIGAHTWANWFWLD